MTINPTPAFRLPINPLTSGQAVRPPVAPTAAAPADPASAVRAPEGVNPQLWGVLTDDEQAFFMKQHSLGPLTYGPKQTTHIAAEAPRGQRIDVRV